MAWPSNPTRFAVRSALAGQQVTPPQGAALAATAMPKHGGIQGSWAITTKYAYRHQRFAAKRISIGAIDQGYPKDRLGV